MEEMCFVHSVGRDGCHKVFLYLDSMNDDDDGDDDVYLVNLWKQPLVSDFSY